MDVHLIDGTYELFRYHFGAPSHVTAQGREVAATRGVVASMVTLLEEGATHVGIATDHVIESFRNDLWPGYKDGSGVEPALLGQFPLLEEVLEAAGFVVWAMVDTEADDALGAAALQASADPAVDQVIICTPDKDLAQCVVDDRVVQFDRRKQVTMGRDGVIEKFGVEPASIPDYLALVGDTADGFPGLPGWGAKSASAVLARYGHLEAIPASASAWDGVDVRSAAKLAVTLQDQLDDAVLFRLIATIRTDAVVLADVDELRWTGPTSAFAAAAAAIDAPRLIARVERLAAARS